MSASAIFRIIGILVVLIIAWQLFIHLLGLFILACIVLGFFALLYFGARLIWGAAKKSNRSAAAVTDTKGNEVQQNSATDRLRVWEAHGGATLYTNKPSIAELTGNAVSEPALLERKGAVVRINNNTLVSVVDYESSDALKVKILDGESAGKIGWISRSALVKDS